jgi:hypothetical protein
VASVKEIGDHRLGAGLGLSPVGDCPGRPPRSSVFCDREPPGEADGVAIVAGVGETEGATVGVSITARGPEPSGATLRTPGASVGFGLAPVLGVMLRSGRCRGDAVACGDGVGETVALSCGVGAEYKVIVKNATVRANASIDFIESLDRSFMALFEETASRGR